MAKDIANLAHQARLTAKASARLQRGLSLTQLVLILAFLGFFGVLGAKSVPAWNEYFAIQRAINRIETSGDSSVTEARKTFDRFAEIDRITSIKGSDIAFEPGKNGLVGHFDYEARVSIAGNVYLLFEFKN